MSESTADAAELGLPAAGVEPQTWKKAIATIFALLLAVLFFSSGSWKLAEPFRWATALTEFKVAAGISLPFTLALGIGEAFGAVLILVPRYRRLGSWLIALLLALFITYVGINYSTLVGKECSCFPIVKRTIGPGFFAADGAMLLMAAVAGWWTRRTEGIRGALVILGAVVVFAGVSLGVNAARESGLKAPASITVDGKPFSLEQGQVFLFFYNPSCLHCDAAARRMSKLNWKSTKVVAIPTVDPRYAQAFLRDTGLGAGTSLDVELLRGTFKFVDPPYGVALERGRQRAAISAFDESEPAATLRKAGFVE